MLYLILCDEKFTTFVGVNGEFRGETSNNFCVLNIMNKRLVLNLIALTFAVVTFTMCNSKPVAVPSTPEEALAELIAGNERFVNEKCIHPHGDMYRVEKTAPHQAPFAAVVGCSDSRVPVELLFD